MGWRDWGAAVGEVRKRGDKVDVGKSGCREM